MHKIFEIVKDNPLFEGIDLGGFEALLACIQGRLQAYGKGEAILLAGHPVETVGLVVSGCVQVVRESPDGKPNLMAELGTGELFAEVFACAGVAQSPVTVLAAQPCQVLHINYRRIMTSCSSACVFHQRLIENMLTLVARKNLLLHQKIEILSRRTTRERLLLFFDLYRQGEREFTLPYNREELAAYLCILESSADMALRSTQR